MPKRPDAIPRDAFPAGMGGDERAMRASLYAAWAKSAGAFRYQLLIAADWFADRGHPDEAVCRSEWVPRGMNSLQADPAGWWRWSARPAAPTGWSVGRACLASRSHNSALWLCWPRGWVRFTGGYLLRDGYMPIHCHPRDDAPTVPDAWCVSVQPHATKYGTPACNRHGAAEWTKLFHPPGSFPDGAAFWPAPPGLFDDV